MNYKDIIQLLATHPILKDVAQWMNSNAQSLHLGGLHASGKSMMLSTIQQTTGMKMLVVAEDAETAAYLYNDINRAMPVGKCGLLPSSYKKSYDKTFCFIFSSCNKFLNIIVPIKKPSKKIIVTKKYNLIL